MGVLSTQLVDAPHSEGAHIRLRSAEPADLLRELEAEGLCRVYIDGAATVQGFLRAGLVDRITVATVPILLGSGRPLFAEMEHESKLELESSVVLDSGIVKSTYRRWSKA